MKQLTPKPSTTVASGIVTGYSAWNNNMQDWIMERTQKRTQRPEVSTLWCKVHEIWIETPMLMYKYRGL